MLDHDTMALSVVRRQLVPSEKAGTAQQWQDKTFKKKLIELPSGVSVVVKELSLLDMVESG